MGTLNLPSSGAVYVDANCIIYAVEKVEPYHAALNPLWHAAAAGQLTLISSELTALETLVKPIRECNAQLEAALRAVLFHSSELRLMPIELHIIERAATIRAQTGLKAPDAIHAATALSAAVTLTVSNDPAFRRVPGLNVVVLSEVLASV